jgi:hypothetical protein
MSHRFASREQWLPRIDAVLRPDNVLDLAAVRVQLSARMARGYVLILATHPTPPAALCTEMPAFPPGVGGVFMRDSEALRHGLNERIRVDAFGRADLLVGVDPQPRGRLERPAAGAARG